MLIKVIAAHKNQRLEGRIRLQKTVYLLKHFGLPFKEKYKYLQFGPYSEELSYEIRELKRYNLVEETGGPPVGPYFYRLTPESKTFLKSFPKEKKSDSKIQELVNVLENYDPRALELLSTAYFIESTHYPRKKAWKMLKELKPERATNTSLKKAQNLDKELKNALELR